MSIYMQYAPYNLRNSDWDSQRDALGDTVVKTLAEYAPDLVSLIEAREVITPKDLEQTYGLTGGHIFHGELALDQLFTMRPLLDWAQYSTSIKGLYLCGSGTHPGTGLNGMSGANAAKEILRDDGIAARTARLVSGHDFSRAEPAATKVWVLAKLPCGTTKALP